MLNISYDPRIVSKQKSSKRKFSTVILKESFSQISSFLAKLVCNDIPAKGFQFHQYIKPRQVFQY